MVAALRSTGVLLCYASLILFSLLVSTTSALSAAGQRVLVVLSPSESKSQYSTFFGDLEARGFQISYRDISSGPALEEYDERSFDHLVWLGEGIDSPPKDLSAQAIVSFAKAGGNALFAYSSDRSDWLRDLAREFSLEFAAKSDTLVDHFNYATKSDQGRHTSLLVGGSGDDASAGGIVSNDAIFTASTLSQAQSSPLLLGDVSVHRLGSNPLAFPVVTPSATSYTAGGRLGTEQDVAVASAFQLKSNSARVVFLGSVEALSDKALSSKSLKGSNGKSYGATLNAAFAADLSSWTFQEHAVLRVERRSHYRVRSSATDIRPPYEEPEEGGSSKMYRIKDTVTYALDLSQHTPAGWVPAPEHLDLQVSLEMLDPFITTKLHAGDGPSSSISSEDPLALSGQSNATTRYSSTFQLPDRLGVYTFHVHWSRPGWSFIETKDIAPIRAFNHDEGERYLPASWPYAAGAVSVIASWVLFVALWLWAGEKEAAELQKEKKKQ